MFKHHKFCVIEISGHLRGHKDSQGKLRLWIIDTPGLAENTESAQSSQIRIVDDAFCDYVSQQVTPTSTTQYLLTARITGNVNLDGDDATLGDISQATLLSGDTTLVYDPQGLG